MDWAEGRGLVGACVGGAAGGAGRSRRRGGRRREGSGGEEEEEEEPGGDAGVVAWGRGFSFGLGELVGLE